MLEKLKAIEDAIQKDCFLPALALALTIPDICGELEYPSFKHLNGNRNVGRQYRTWFQEWVLPLYNDPLTLVERDVASTSNNLSAQEAYHLRCSFLHSGALDALEFHENIETAVRHDYTFELSYHHTLHYTYFWSSNILQSYGDVQEHHLSIDIKEICMFLTKAGYSYYHAQGIPKAHELGKKD